MPTFSVQCRRTRTLICQQTKSKRAAPDPGPRAESSQQGYINLPGILCDPFLTYFFQNIFPNGVKTKIVPTDLDSPRQSSSVVGKLISYKKSSWLYLCLIIVATKYQRGNYIRSLPILSGLLKFTQDVFAKRFENTESTSDGTEY